MALDFVNRLNKGKTYIAKADSKKKVIALTLLVIGLAALVLALIKNNEAQYDVLYSQLAPEDAGAIVEELKKRQVPYRLNKDGTTIELPSEKNQETRLSLAVLGLPKQSNVGLEIFDRQKIGTTDFAQKINLQRAISGELERTIMQFPEVEQARVHLSVPAETLFIEEQQASKASVVLTLKSGAKLDKAKLLGIVHLMTSAVDSLAEDNVSITDTSGGLLWSKDSGRPGALDEDQLKQQNAYEQSLTDKVNSLIEKVVGPNRSSTRVSVELDLKEVITNEDIYDPEKTAVRSESRINKRQEGPARGSVGSPNATYELGTGNRGFQGEGGSQELYSESEELTNYEISNIKRQIISSAGDIKKLTVAVMVDGIWQKGEDGERLFIPMPQNQLEQLINMVKNTIGYDESRGDSVSVESVSFYRPEEIPYWANFAMELAQEFYRPFINIILIIFFFFFVVRPIVNWLKKEVEPSALAPELAVLPQLPLDPSDLSELKLDSALTLEETKNIADIFPEKTSMLEQGKENLLKEDLSLEQLKGHLNRDRVLPVARTDMDKTLGQLRAWIEVEEKPPTSENNFN